MLLQTGSLKGFGLFAYSKEAVPRRWSSWAGLPVPQRLHLEAHAIRLMPGAGAGLPARGATEGLSHTVLLQKRSAVLGSCLVLLTSCPTLSHPAALPGRAGSIRIWNNLNRRVCGVWIGVTLCADFERLLAGRWPSHCWWHVLVSGPSPTQGPRKGPGPALVYVHRESLWSCRVRSAGVHVQLRHQCL